MTLEEVQALKAGDEVIVTNPSTQDSGRGVVRYNDPDGNGYLFIDGVSVQFTLAHFPNGIPALSFPP